MPFPFSIFVSTERRSPPSVLLMAVFFLLAGLLAPSPLAAKGPTPDQVISLESLGFQTIAPRYLVAGGTMMTLDYVDNNHLLVTFGVPRLMRRLTDCAPDDQDRVVDAVLLELPSGRELAHTEWRLHDIGQYLWPLGQGYFLLRQRNLLTTFAPLAQLPLGDAFRQHPFLHFDNPIDAIYVSADRDLLTIETSKRVARHGPPPAAGATPPVTALPTSLGPSQPNSLKLQRRDPSRADATGDDASDTPENPVHISFIRLLAPSTANGSLVAQHAGTLDTRKHLLIPLTAEGYLRTRDVSRGGVTLDFATFSGKITDLGGFDTTCQPSPTFLTHSEFVAFGCRGSEDRLTLAGFNVHGDLLWQMLFSDTQAYPSFAAANSAGRFAFSRTLTSGGIIDVQSPFPDQLTAQEVRVLQTYNGKQLLRVATSPIQRSGHNFALSPDGLSLAVIHDPVDPHLKEVQHKPAIEIYKLPPLTDKDLHEVNAEMALSPPHSEAPIAFATARVQDAVGSPAGQAGQSNLDATEIDPASDFLPELLPATVPAPAPAAPSSAAPAPAAPPDNSRPHFSYRSSDATVPPPSPKPETQSNEQGAGSTPEGDQPNQTRKPPSLYDPDYDGSRTPSPQTPQQ